MIYFNIAPDNFSFRLVAGARFDQAQPNAKLFTAGYVFCLHPRAISGAIILAPPEDADVSISRVSQPIPKNDERDKRESQIVAHLIQSHSNIHVPAFPETKSRCKLVHRSDMFESRVGQNQREKSMGLF